MCVCKREGEGEEERERERGEPAFKAGSYHFQDLWTSPEY
jgi:hypothetical protein